MPTMTQSEIDAFLTAPHNAVVGTNRVDGPPQLTSVWYLYEQGRLYISTENGTAKYRNLRRDPRISVCVDGGVGDYRTVVVYGTVDFMSADDPAHEDIRWRITQQYYDNEADARRFFASTRSPRHVMLVVTPTKIIGEDYN